jgi:ComF family protein
MAKIAKKFPELNEFLKNATLVPIPLHNARAISRKYNQSELIAKMLIQTFPDTNAKVKTILKRTRRTPTQTTLDRNARALNIKNAFVISKTKSINSIKKDANIILVDDVMTSGATLSECAKTLKKAGFKNVGAFTFSKRL